MTAGPFQLLPVGDCPECFTLLRSLRDVSERRSGTCRQRKGAKAHSAPLKMAFRVGSQTWPKHSVPCDRLSVRLCCAVTARAGPILRMRVQPGLDPALALEFQVTLDSTVSSSWLAGWLPPLLCFPLLRSHQSSHHHSHSRMSSSAASSSSSSSSTTSRAPSRSSASYESFATLGVPAPLEESPVQQQQCNSVRDIKGKGKKRMITLVSCRLSSRRCESPR